MWQPPFALIEDPMGIEMPVGMPAAVYVSTIVKDGPLTPSHQARGEASSRRLLYLVNLLLPDGDPG